MPENGGARTGRERLRQCEFQRDSLDAVTRARSFFGALFLSLSPSYAMHGQFVWYELTTPDVAAAKKFYPPIAGWGTQQFDKDYTMWTTRGVPFAGIFQLGPEQRQKGIPPNWMPYVDVDNVDETARKATSLGGKTMHGPQDIPNTGRFAVLQDPQGAVFGVYKSNRSSQAWDGTPVVE